MNGLNNDSAETLRKIYLLHKRVVIFLVGVMSLGVLTGIVGCVLIFILFTAVVDSAAQGLKQTSGMTSDSLKDLNNSAAQLERQFQELQRTTTQRRNPQQTIKPTPARQHAPHPMIPR
ncbi:hypothetical protein DES53_102771 [Roseimicrobium gellanilyticum]|uniref:Uncharacterized protein n=1 Tax=Roseimicrobium gellanilyticum TaxID=748857 RepID=A0A366HRS3_9BACT|nr:hypothetical protein DES53_102771 [Roseimicrobium gellanilyticum]